MLTILRPDAQKTVVTPHNIERLRAEGRVNPLFQLPAATDANPLPTASLYLLEEFVAVPAILTHGTWRILDLLPAEQVAALARFANTLEKRDRRGTRTK